MNGRHKRGVSLGLLLATAGVIATTTASVFVGGIPAAEASTTACGQVILAGTQWLGGKGADVHSNGSEQGKGVNCGSDSTSNPAVQDGNAWQCVELAARLYYLKGWGTVHTGGNGGAYYIPEGSPSLTFHANGSGYVPVPGDLIIYKPTATNKYGHVSIVDRIVGATINVVEQNATSSGRGTLSISGSTISGGVRGVMHSPRNAPAAKVVLLAQPTSPRVASTTSTSAVLTWKDASNNETGFVSQYRIGSGPWAGGPSVGANKTSMTVSGLKAGTSYTFQVGARNSAGTHWSAYFSGKTAAPPASPPKATPPAAYHAGRQVTIDTHATGGVSGHKGTGNSYAAGPTHAKNTALWIVCYVTGQSITGPYDTTTMWDLSDDGYYYTDAWLYTGTNSAAVPKCAPKTVTVDKHATGGVSGHKGPGNTYAAGPTHAVNAPVAIFCYVTGQSITGPYDTTTMWDLSDDGYYYTDAWLYTGTNGAAVPHC